MMSKSICLFSNTSTLFISKTMGEHLSSMLAARIKTGVWEHYLPWTQHGRISHHQWKNPSSNPCWGERFVIPISLVLGGEDKGLIACKTERHSKDRLTEGERRKGKRRDKERKMERFGWLGLRDDREPGALLQEKVKHFHKSVLEEFTCSGGRLKSCHTWLVEREKPIPNTGGHLHRRKKKKKKKLCFLITLSSPSHLQNNHSSCWRR